MAMTLRGVDLAIDYTGYLPPVGFGLESADTSQVTVYVATRDMPEYVDAAGSIEASYSTGKMASSLAEIGSLERETQRSGRVAQLVGTLGNIRAAFTAHPGLPKLDLVVLDVGSVVPLDEGSLATARVERIGSSGETGVPVFHAWEHIARTSKSERVMFFDEDVLIPKTFNWPLYLQGAWFFKKDFRDYTACWSVPRTAIVNMVARLRATPHLYTTQTRWGGQEDKLAMYAMDLQKAPDQLALHKLGSTQAFQGTLEDTVWQDTVRVFDRYLLEWNREGDPGLAFTASVHGPLSLWSTRMLLRGYGLWSILDLALLVQMHLVSPHGHVKSWLCSLAESIHEVQMLAWIPKNMQHNIIVDGGAFLFICVAFVSINAILVSAWSRVRKQLDSCEGPKESDPLLAFRLKLDRCEAHFP